MSDKMKIKVFSCIMLTLLFLCACRTQSVYAKEKITVGTNAEYAPFEYLDSNGNPLVQALVNAEEKDGWIRMCNSEGSFAGVYQWDEKRVH